MEKQDEYVYFVTKGKITDHIFVKENRYCYVVADKFGYETIITKSGRIETPVVCYDYVKEATFREIHKAIDFCSKQNNVFEQDYMSMLSGFKKRVEESNGDQEIMDEVYFNVFNIIENLIKIDTILSYLLKERFLTFIRSIK